MTEGPTGGLRAGPCSLVSAFAFTSPEKAQPYLPEPWPSGAFIPGTYAVEVLLVTCEHVVLNNISEVANVEWVEVHIAVDPPDEFEPPPGWGRAAIIGLWSDSDEIIDFWSTIGVNASRGTFTMNHEPVDEDVQVTTGEFSTEANGPEWRFTLMTDQRPAPESDANRGFFWKDNAVRFLDTTYDGLYGDQDYGGEFLFESESMMAGLFPSGQAVPFVTDIGADLTIISLPGNGAA